MPGPLSPEDLKLAIARYQGLPASEPLPSNVVDPWAGQPEQAQEVPPPMSATDATWANAEQVDSAPAASLEPPAPQQHPALSAPHTFDQGIQNISLSSAKAADAIRNQAAVQGQANEAQAGIYGQQAAELEARQQAMAAREEEYRKTNAETVKEFQRLNEQASNMRIVDRRSTGQKVMGVLGVALGGLGDAFAKMGGNRSTQYADSVQNQLNYVIQRDLEQQREAIGDKRKAAAAKLTELGLARSAFSDEMHAENFATSQLQLKYASQLKQVAANTQNEQLAAAAEVAATQLESQATQLQAKLIADRDEQKMRSRMLAGAGGAGGGGTMSSTEILRKFDAGEPLTKAEREFALKLDAGRDRDQRTADQKAAREAAAEDRRRKEAESKANKPESEGIMKARALIESSAKPAARLQERLSGDKDLPGFISSQSPDWVRGTDDALFWQDVDSTARDLLRYESGASISTEETMGLIKRSQSTDPAVRRQAVERLLDKRAAIQHSLPKREPPQAAVSAPTSAGQAGGSAEQTMPGVRFEVNGKVGSVPADRVEDFLRKYPNARRL